jgi:hypothetical protein
MPCGPCLELGRFHIVGGLGIVAKEVMKIHSCESEFGRKGRVGGRGVDGQYVENGRE